MLIDRGILTVDTSGRRIWLSVGTVLIQVALGVRITVSGGILGSLLDVQDAIVSQMKS